TGVRIRPHTNTPPASNAPLIFRANECNSGNASARENAVFSAAHNSIARARSAGVDITARTTPVAASATTHAPASIVSIRATKDATCDDSVYIVIAVPAPVPPAPAAPSAPPAAAGSDVIHNRNRPDCAAV